MGFLFAKSKKEVPALTGMQIQTAVNVLPVPIIYGCPRLQMNVIYINGFRHQKKSSGGGKGLLTGGKGGSGETKYYASFLGALGEGTLGQIRVVFDNAAVYTPSTAPEGKVFVEFVGSETQVAWETIVDKWPNDAFDYKNTAYIAFYDFPLDSSATIPLLGFIVEGLFQGTCPLNLYTAPDSETIYFDADPAQCIHDFLTNSRYGAGFPVEYIDSTTVFTSSNGFIENVGDAALSTYCQAIGMGWSIVLNNAEPAMSYLERWCKNLVVAPVWTGSKLKFIPYADSYVGTNPGWGADAGVAKKYYQPDLTILFSFNDDDYLQAESGEDPIVVTRIDSAEVKNTVRLDYQDRYNAFNSSVAEAKDESSVELDGHRVERMGTADEFTIVAYAAAAAQMQLQRNIAIRNTYTFKLRWQWCILEPMDIIAISDSTLGLDEFVVRIRSIEEDEKGILTLSCEEFPIGSGTPVAYPREISAPSRTFETQTPAPAVNIPIIFEPTSRALIAEGQSSATIVLGACGGPGGLYDANWGGANIWLSNDNITYSDGYGTVDGPSRMGVTTAILGSFLVGLNPDNTHTLSVNVSESNAVLETVTSASAASGANACVIVEPDGTYEILTFTTATLTGPGQYSLTGLYRALYGTKACAHTSGAGFLRLDGLPTQIPLATGFIGTTIYIKLQSFNMWGQGVQPLADCIAYTYVPTGLGLGVTANTTLAQLALGNPVDLNTATTEAADLNLGGANACAPDPVAIDLGGA